MASRLLLGIDPGLADTGWGLVLVEGSKLRHRGHGVIRTSSEQTFEQRLLILHTQIFELIREHKPVGAAIEQLFFAKNSSSAMAVAHARGVLCLALAQSGIVVREFTPMVIKQAVCGTGSADKAQVQGMTKLLLGLQAIPKPDHAADALAAAICLAYTGGIHV